MSESPMRVVERAARQAYNDAAGNARLVVEKELKAAVNKATAEAITRIERVKQVAVEDFTTRVLPEELSQVLSSLRDAAASLSQLGQAMVVLVESLNRQQAPKSVRRTIERDADGRMSALIEEREL